MLFHNKFLRELLPVCCRAGLLLLFLLTGRSHVSHLSPEDHVKGLTRPLGHLLASMPRNGWGSEVLNERMFLLRLCGAIVGWYIILVLRSYPDANVYVTLNIMPPSFPRFPQQTVLVATACSKCLLNTTAVQNDSSKYHTTK